MLWGGIKQRRLWMGMQLFGGPEGGAGVGRNMLIPRLEPHSRMLMSANSGGGA